MRCSLWFVGLPKVGGNAGEIADLPVNDCLADDGLAAILVRYLSNFVV